MLELIDTGGSEGGAAGQHWVLDPIDGTRGFVGLRQYAICLGMLQEGKVPAAPAAVRHPCPPPPSPPGARAAPFPLCPQEGQAFSTPTPYPPFPHPAMPAEDGI